MQTVKSNNQLEKKPYVKPMAQEANPTRCYLGHITHIVRQNFSSSKDMVWAHLHRFMGVACVSVPVP